MTDQERDLLLIDLSARIPFHVKVETGENYPYVLQGVSNGDLGWSTWDESGDNDLFKTRPYLYPFSCMTEEIEVNGEKFIPLVKYAKERHRKHYGEEPASVVIDGNTVFTYCQDHRMNRKTSLRDTLQKAINVDFCHRYHIDWRGLIDMGLAIDARTFNAYHKSKDE